MYFVYVYYDDKDFDIMAFRDLIDAQKAVDYYKSEGKKVDYEWVGD